EGSVVPGLLGPQPSVKRNAPVVARAISFRMFDLSAQVARVQPLARFDANVSCSSRACRAILPTPHDGSIVHDRAMPQQLNSRLGLWPQSTGRRQSAREREVLDQRAAPLRTSTRRLTQSRQRIIGRGRAALDLSLERLEEPSLGAALRVAHVEALE